MRNLVFVLLAAALTGCVTISVEPSATPTPAPTQLVTQEPTAQPTVTAELTPTSSPNLTPTPILAEQTATPGASGELIDLRPYLTSEVTVVNLTDEVLTLVAVFIDPESDDEFPIGEFEAGPSQVTAQLVIPGRYRLDFSYASARAVGGTCTVDIDDGVQAQFAAATTGIVMTLSTGEPDDAADLVVATSSLCQEGGIP